MKYLNPDMRVEPHEARVSLVGAGPGDPGLLTLMALNRLEEADLVFYDALVPCSFLAVCSNDARLVSVGRRRGEPSVPPEKIYRAMEEAVRAGRNVVRLKGGDSFVFGRGAEEALALLERGIPVEIIPGVSALTGVPAAAGIPLTHRGAARSAAFLTAHDLGDHDTGRDLRRRLHHLAQGADTLVVFMAGKERHRVRRALEDAGLPPGTPAAVLEAVGLPEERIQITRLGSLDDLPEETGDGPILIVIGETVALSTWLRPAAAHTPATEALQHTLMR